LQQFESAEAEIQAWCIRYLAETLEVPPAEVDPSATFARLGLDSATAIFLVTALEDWLGIDLSAEIVFDHPTVAEMARHLALMPEVARKLGQPVT
jgi:acyl carrier protein